MGLTHKPGHAHLGERPRARASSASCTASSTRRPSPRAPQARAASAPSVLDQRVVVVELRQRGATAAPWSRPRPTKRVTIYLALVDDGVFGTAAGGPGVDRPEARVSVVVSTRPRGPTDEDDSVTARRGPPERVEARARPLSVENRAPQANGVSDTRTRSPCTPKGRADPAPGASSRPCDGVAAATSAGRRTDAIRSRPTRARNAAEGRRRARDPVDFVGDAVDHRIHTGNHSRPGSGGGRWRRAPGVGGRSRGRPPRGPPVEPAPVGPVDRPPRAAARRARVHRRHPRAREGAG